MVESLMRNAKNSSRLSPQPITYMVDIDFALEELDHADMVALSHMFQRWAIDEENIEPENRTELIQWSADLERLAGRSLLTPSSMELPCTYEAPELQRYGHRFTTRRVALSLSDSHKILLGP